MVCGLSSSERVERVERPRNYKPENRPQKYRLRLRAVIATSRKILSSSSRRGALSVGGWGLGEVGASTPALSSYLLSAWP